MVPKVPARASDDQGFTLIELLVVTLIVGILAALAIPSFLSQTGKAHDVNAKSIARTAQLAEETVFTESQTYLPQAVGAGATGALNQIEPTLIGPSAACVGSPPYAVSPCGLSASAAGSGFQVSVTSKTGVAFTLARSDLGVVTRTCDVSGVVGGNAGCAGVVGTSGSW